MIPLRNTDLRPWLKPALLALIPVVVVAVVLDHSLTGVLKSRALTTAKGQAQLVSRSAFEPRVSTRELERGLQPSQRRVLRRAFGELAASGEFTGATLWSRKQRSLASFGRIRGHRSGSPS